jgi:uncharacterized protein
MNIQLDAIEARILGSLMEKSVVTRDQYPLSLNALVNACNQKSSRDPVMDLSEAEVHEALEALKRRYLVREQSGFGSRVVKYHYRLGNDEIGGFRFSDAERAIVCLLLLRGPQTPGELRARSGRLYEFADIDEVEATVQHLRDCDRGPFVVPLPREPGRREVRYRQLFTDPQTGEAADTPQAVPVSGAVRAHGDVHARLARLEERVEVLETTLLALLPKDRSPP